MKTPLLLAFAAVAFVGSCAKNESSALPQAPAAKHEHHAPHGGTPVVLGNEAYHLEFVRDATTGKMIAYVLDGEMENFVRVKAAAFDVVVGPASSAEKRIVASRTLTFRAVANSATGETVGDTSQFEAEAEWLKSAASFDASLTTLEIKGTTFTGVPFNFPKGNDRD